MKSIIIFIFLIILITIYIHDSKNPLTYQNILSEVKQIT